MNRILKDLQIPGSQVYTHWLMQLVEGPCIGDGLPTFNDGNPYKLITYNGYINAYYWVDDHPLLYVCYIYIREIMGV